MLYFILIALLVICLVLAIVLIAILVKANERFQTEIAFLQEEARNNSSEASERDSLYMGTVNLLYQQIEELEKEAQHARDNLAMVLTADPTPFNQVAVELGLHGVVYQFHSLEDSKEITA